MSIDLTTHYLGMTLRNPIVASSSPLTGKVASLIELEESGAAAVVLPSLFEEQVGPEPGASGSEGSDDPASDEDTDDADSGDPDLNGGND